LVFSSFLRRGRAWARYCVIVVSVMNLFSVPIGTALGIYSLWALLLRDRAADYFD